MLCPNPSLKRTQRLSPILIHTFDEVVSATVATGAALVVLEALVVLADSAALEALATGITGDKMRKPASWLSRWGCSNKVHFS